MIIGFKIKWDSFQHLETSETLKSDIKGLISEYRISAHY